MKSVLISIQPKWCELIASGKKTIEVRKSKPKLDVPFKCYIYCTLPPKEELFTHGCIREYANELIRLQDGKIVYDYGMRLCCDIENRPYSQDNFLCKKVIGEFICNNIDWHGLNNLIVKEDAEHTLSGTCLTEAEVLDYLGYQKGTNIYACKNYDFYGWHISDLKIYDKPKELGEFYRYCGDNPKCEGCEAHYYSNTECGLEDYCCSIIEGCKPIKRPPQSWCYVESEVTEE